MPKLIIVGRDGARKEVEAEPGLTVMEIARANDFDDLLAICGGSCSCATCHVYVDEAFLDRLPPIGGDENDLLDSSSNRSITSRLSCQVVFTDRLDGLKVTVAPDD